MEIDEIKEKIRELVKEIITDYSEKLLSFPFEIIDITKGKHRFFLFVSEQKVILVPIVLWEELEGVLNIADGCRERNEKFQFYLYDLENIKKIYSVIPRLYYNKELSQKNLDINTKED